MSAPADQPLHPDLGVLVVHGMGRQQPGYSDEMRREVCRRLGDAASRIAWQEVFWADLLEAREAELWERMTEAHDPTGRALPLDWGRVRRFVIHNFGDALAYQRDYARDASTYDRLHALVSEAIEALQTRLAAADTPVVVMAHSLGAHVMSCYLWDRQRFARSQDPARDPDPYRPLPSLAAMITFGCNIPLFSLAFPVAVPVDVPGAAIGQPALVCEARWLNYFDRDDVLGWPLRPLYEKNADELDENQRATLDRLEDYEINVGTAGLALTPASHVAYWKDDDFTTPVARYLERLLAALDE